MQYNCALKHSCFNQGCITPEVLYGHSRHYVIRLLVHVYNV